MLGHALAALPVVAGAYFALDEYGQRRRAGENVASAGIKAVGSQVAWTFAPGAMTALSLTPAIVPIVQAAHQVGTQRVAQTRLHATPFGTNYDFGDTELAQQRRYAAMTDLNRTANVARSQARRMRG